MLGRVDMTLTGPDKGSAMEHKTRQEQNFHEVEAQLPDIRLRPGSAADTRPDLTTDVLSHLGPWNPVRHEISKDDTVWLLDNTAHRNESGEWEAEFVVAVFGQNTGVEVSRVVASVAEKVGIERGHNPNKIEERIRNRLMPFVQSVLPGRVVRADFGSQHKLKLGPGGRNGISSDDEPLPEFRDGQVVWTVAKVPQGANGILEMKTVFAEPRGWGVISGLCCGKNSETLIDMTRHRRYNQNHHDKRPHRYPQINIHRRPNPRERDARTLPVHPIQHRIRITILLPLGLTLQPVFLPSRFSSKILSARNHDP